MNPHLCLDSFPTVKNLFLWLWSCSWIFRSGKEYVGTIMSGLDLLGQYRKDRKNWDDKGLKILIVFRPRAADQRYYTWLQATKYPRMMTELENNGFSDFSALPKEERTYTRTIPFVEGEPDELVFIFMVVHESKFLYFTMGGNCKISSYFQLFFQNAPLTTSTFNAKSGRRKPCSTRRIMNDWTTTLQK